MKIEIEQTVNPNGEIDREIMIHAEGEPMSLDEEGEMHGMIRRLNEGLDDATDHVGDEWRFLVTCVREDA